MTTARILSGKMLSNLVRERVAVRTARSAAAGRRKPGLAVVLVGDNPASQTYVASKSKAAEGCGFSVRDVRFAAAATQKEIASAIDELNGDPAVDGILLQLPLPTHLDSESLIGRISHHKDVDGLHPYNQGLLFSGRSGIRPCTPLGVMHLVDLAFNIELQCESPAFEPRPVSLAGKRVVIIGRSVLVGRPLAALMLERDATVTIVHSKTAAIEETCRGADILVAAVGRPELVRSSWIKPGAVVIDVGINRAPAGGLVGDVAFADALAAASAVTPVPGGVGPMTVAMLMANTLEAFEWSQH